MKNYFAKVLTKFITPFYGTGIWTRFPFKYINDFYKYISKWNVYIYNTEFWFKLYIESWKLIDDTIKFTWVWEKNITNLICKNLKEWDIFIDVWSNIWYDTLLASVKVWETGKVLSFEPVLENFQRLEKNIKINNFKNIEYFNYWLWSKQERMNIFYDEDNPWASSITSYSKNNWKPKRSIEIKDFDSTFCNIYPTLLKIDIEWFEMEAFKWMKNLLSQDIKIIFEYSPVIYDNDLNNTNKSLEILHYISHFWFNIYHIDNEWNLTLINNYQEYYIQIKNSVSWQADLFCSKNNSLDLINI